MSRAMSRPFATLLAIVSAILIVVGRVDRDVWWGDRVLITGFAVLAVGGALYLLGRR
jgi:hypothetical protein